MAMEEELLSRQPAHSLEAEQAVLGSVLIDSRCVANVICIVKPEDFYLQQNQEKHGDEQWQERMMELEMRVSDIEEYRNIAFFHHLIFTKA